MTVDVEVGMAKEAVVKGFAIKDCVCHGSTATVAVAVAAGAEAGGRGTEGTEVGKVKNRKSGKRRAFGLWLGSVRSPARLCEKDRGLGLVAA